MKNNTKDCYFYNNEIPQSSNFDSTNKQRRFTLENVSYAKAINTGALINEVKGRRDTFNCTSQNLPEFSKIDSNSSNSNLSNKNQKSKNFDDYQQRINLENVLIINF